MSEYHKLQKGAAEARVGADRMAMGLPCIPDPLRGDMAEIERLRAALWQIDNGGSWESNQLRDIARKALEGK